MEELGETEEEGSRTSLISYPGRELSSTDLDRSQFAYSAQIRKRDKRRGKFIFCVSKQIFGERRTNDVNNADLPSKAVLGAEVNPEVNPAEVLSVNITFATTTAAA